MKHASDANADAFALTRETTTCAIWKTRESKHYQVHNNSIQQKELSYYSRTIPQVTISIVRTIQKGSNMAQQRYPQRYLLPRYTINGDTRMDIFHTRRPSPMIASSEAS